MALHTIEFTVPPGGAYESIPVDWAHSGVVGSGDMELLLRRGESSGVRVKIVTPVTGYDEVWQCVLQKFIRESGLGGLEIEINDNGATPFVVGMRLNLGLQQARAGEQE